MTRLNDALLALRGLLEMGGAVVAILLAMSVVAGAVTLYKLWQYRVLSVGRHSELKQALALWKEGSRPEAQNALAGVDGIAAIATEGMRAPDDQRAGRRELLYAESDLRMARIESGFRLLDATSQLGPLLGLFGTVLGMIKAFQAMEGAGSNVDPSVLASGIWVALLTTAVGLAVSMSSMAVLTWLESRAAAERVMSDLAIETVCAPPLRPGAADDHARPVVALSRHA